MFSILSLHLRGCMCVCVCVCVGGGGAVNIWRRPQNMKNLKSQPLIVSFSSFKFKIRGPSQNWQLVEKRQPPMEDDLKRLKVEYLSNHWSDLPQVLNLSLYLNLKLRGPNLNWVLLDIKMTSSGRQPQYYKWNISATTDQIFLKC